MTNRKKRTLRGIITACLVFTLCAAAWWVVRVSPLPTDATLIGRFTQHRQDYEGLVKMYRDYEPESPEAPHEWFRTELAREMRQRASVGHLSDSGLGLWLPQPYSLKTAQKIHDLRWGTSSVAKWSAKARNRFLPVSIKPVHDDYLAFSLRYGLVVKYYVRFPEPPKVVNGQLLLPIDVSGHSDTRRVVESLDVYPSNWRAGECVYKQIEPRWFLAMCTSR